MRPTYRTVDLEIPLDGFYGILYIFLTLPLKTERSSCTRSAWGGGGGMRNLVIGCAVAAVVALTARSEARVPANHQLREPIQAVPVQRVEVGLASWYGAESQGITASGETYDLSQLTAAHRTLPLQSRIKVTNLKNNRSVILRVNDRGPNVYGRLLDVSQAAAERLGFVGTGKVPVRITVLRYPKGYIAQPVVFNAYPNLTRCRELVK